MSLLVATAAKPRPAAIGRLGVGSEIESLVPSVG